MLINVDSYIVSPTVSDRFDTSHICPVFELPSETAIFQPWHGASFQPVQLVTVNHDKPTCNWKTLGPYQPAMIFKCPKPTWSQSSLELVLPPMRGSQPDGGPLASSIEEVTGANK